VKSKSRRKVKSPVKTKEEVLKKHADKLLKQDERNQKLKEKTITIDPFKLFK